MSTPLTLSTPTFRILIVEDDIEQLRRFRDLILKLGDEFHVTEATSYADVRACMTEDEEQSEPFHVALVDMWLPEGPEAGLDVIELLRKEDQTTDIIVITRVGTLNNVYLAIEKGANQYLTKGLINFEDTLQRVVKERARRTYMYRSTLEYFSGEQNAFREVRELLETLIQQSEGVEIHKFHPHIHRLLRKIETLEAEV